MSTIQELGGFLARETAAGAALPQPPAPPTAPAAEAPAPVDQGANGTPATHRDGSGV